MIQNENLFQPDKYKVYLGEGRTVGFCTVWNEPEAAIKRSEKLLQSSAIVGTLYSRQGVNAIVRNLALNPQIRRLYLWGYGTLSSTPFGLAGKEILSALWKDGIGEDHIVQGTKFKLDAEIPVAIVDSIRTNVELIDVSSSNFDEMLLQIHDDAEVKPYMEPQKFPDPIPEAVESFPSEQVGWLIRAPKIIQAWSRLVDRIMRYGIIKGTQYGMQQRELIGVTWVITEEDPVNPFMDVDWPDDLRKTIGLTSEAIEQYHSVFLSKELPPGIYYTYGNRLMNYTVDGHEPVDQIRDVIIKQLASSPDSRRAVATTMIPTIDKDSKEPPCITQVQAIQSGGALHFLVTVRSHDIFKAAIPNAFGLRTLQKTVADELGFTLGNLQITSQSAHIYEADWSDAKKLAQCEWWERAPDMVFKPEVNADPRGMVVVSIKDDEIVAACKGPTGEDLLTITGKTAKEASLKISHLDLLSRSDHLMDIAMELQKAEIAKRKGVEYTQDRPLVL